jgi:hypothetical protein
MHRSKITTGHYFYMVPLIVILPLSGPLVPAVILIVSFLIFLDLFIQSEKRNPVAFFKSVPKFFLYPADSNQFVEFIFPFFGILQCKLQR